MLKIAVCTDTIFFFFLNDFFFLLISNYSSKLTQNFALKEKKKKRDIFRNKNILQSLFFFNFQNIILENCLVTGRQYQSSEIKPVPMTMKRKAKDIVTE